VLLNGRDHILVSTTAAFPPGNYLTWGKTWLANPSTSKEARIFCGMGEDQSLSISRRAATRC
jgi:hypothetical protein